MVDQLVDDLNTIGLAGERVIIKSDQEASITELQSEIAKRRTTVGTGVENSKVGDSNSNGKIERAIRDVKNMIRTLRSSLSASIGTSVKLDMKIVPWLVRHASYLITRCRVRSHGKTALQLMKGRTSLTELVPFGETVMFKVPKTGHAIGSFEDRWESGIWLGCTIRDGMTLVGTSSGVYKVGTIKRKPDGEQWSLSNVEQLTGSPQQPQPDSESRRITTFAKKKLDKPADRPAPIFQPPVDKPPEPRQAKILKTDVERFGPTAGCPACRAIAAGKPWRSAHSLDCRKRMDELMVGDVEGKRRLDRAAERITHHIVDNSEITEEEEKKRPRLDSPPHAAEASSSAGGDAAAAASSAGGDAAAAASSGGQRSMSDPLVQRLKAAARKNAPRKDDDSMDIAEGARSKRKAEEDPEDPRVDRGDGAELIGENPDGSRVQADGGGASSDGATQGTASGSTGPDVSMDAVDIQMTGLHRCSHCSRRFDSRNEMFRHLYQCHDDDGEGAKARWEMDRRSRSVEFGRTHTDEIAQPALYDQHAQRQQAKSKPSFDPTKLACAALRPVLAVDDFRGHPSPVLKAEEIDKDEGAWKDIGSGMFAKTFKKAQYLPLTTRGGPVASDVHRRIVRSLTTGRVIDDCIVEDVSDAEIYRRLPMPDNIRVELIMQKALAMYQRRGADIVELYSQPRIAQEAGLRKYGGTELVAGWSLDLTMKDPETDKPWDLSKPEIQDKVGGMVSKGKPFMLIGSPPALRFRSCKG